ncbi:MAG: Ldh family oxidoreductase [Bryobacterales bacterium]|nr:Ldh family oxidoreductase [Bryobacterales bacterium]
MPTFTADRLKSTSRDIFVAAGARSEDARIVADALVNANLAGHDSHGVMRIPSYVRWMEKGDVNVKAEFRVVMEADAFAVIDGDWGFGQVMARKAMEVGIEKAAKSGVASISARRCSHIGRAGDYPIMVAEAGLASILFLNTHGAGSLVAPFGGIDRRLSANPIAIGIPRPGGDHIIVDISTCVVAEGKLRNFRTAGQPAPERSIIDAEGRPTTDASEFYGPPEGAILPIAGHKGFALGLASDILAGALSGAGCTRQGIKRVGNSFWATIIDIHRIRCRSDFDRDVGDLIDWIKSSRKADGVSEILVAGEPEQRTQAKREKDGIPIHDATWTAIVETGKRYNLDLE